MIGPGRWLASQVVAVLRQLKLTKFLICKKLSLILKTKRWSNKLRPQLIVRKKKSKERKSSISQLKTSIALRRRTSTKFF